MAQYSEDLAYIHDAGFGDHARRLAPGIIGLLRSHGIERGLIVDAGCGSGILTRSLLEAGYDVLGVDQSPAMVRLARANASAASYRVASIAAVRLPESAAVVAVGEVVTYVPSAAALRRFFLSARRAVGAGGLLVFDFLETWKGRTYARGERSGKDWRIVLRAAADSAGRVLTRRMRLTRIVDGQERRSREDHRIRIYARHEMEAMLRASGFRAIFRRSLGSYRLPTADLIAIARGIPQ